MQNLELLGLFARAFSWRERPSSAVATFAPDTDEYRDAIAFNSIELSEIDCKFLKSKSGCMYGFSPLAFAFYLPYIISAVVREEYPTVEVSNSLINMLDRSSASQRWDENFVEKWGVLTISECRAMQAWVLWLTQYKEVSIFGNELSRAFDTLALLEAVARD